MIGDNLSSHISAASVKLCKDNNIDMIFLPSNSTHLTQPLDIAFFWPLKIYWRQILTEWKNGAGRNESTVPKDIFPCLLNKLMAKIEPTSSDNIKSGFRKCGIIPFNPNMVIDMLPKETTKDTGTNIQSIAGTMDQQLYELLKEVRMSTDRNCQPPKKRLNIAAGKSATVESSSSSEQVDEPNTSDSSIDDENANADSSTSSSDDENANSEASPEVPLDLDSTTAGPSNMKESSADIVPYTNLHENDFVIVKFKTNKRDRRFIAQIQEVLDKAYSVKCLRKKVGSKTITFVFPQIDDICYVTENNIERKIALMNVRRGLHSFLVDATHLE